MERGLVALGGNLETPVESRQELFQYGLGLFNRGCSGEPQFRDQAVLEGSRRSFHTPLRRWRQGENHLSPELVHGPAELGRRAIQTGSRHVLEDPVPVGVEGDRYAEMLHETRDQHE